MLQRLGYAYRNFVPGSVKRSIPLGVKASALGILSKYTGQTEFFFKQARLLQNKGDMDSAANIYGTIAHSGYVESDHQQMSFKSGHQIRTVSNDLGHDPLLACRIEKPSSSDNCTKITASFTYRGLGISAELLADDSMPEYVSIFLDDTALRVERLLWTNRRAKFQFTVKRRTLDYFPGRGCLTLRTGDGNFLHGDGADGLVVVVPHGDGTIFEKVAALGPLEKKGGLRPDSGTLMRRQNAYLDLYIRANAVFEAEFGRQLFLLYGTLLGQHRNGDFIPGDDDFDIGYVSDATYPSAVKREAIEIMRFLASRGFKILVNRSGKPFRLTDPDAGPGIHLDARPVWTAGDGHVWMHKLAHLDVPLDEFRHVVPGTLRNVSIWKPRGTERFLEAYYGAGWRVPDPGFSNSGKLVPATIRKGLEACCLTTAEQKRLMREVQKMRRRDHISGDFVPIRFEPLYPLHVYQARVGE